MSSPRFRLPGLDVRRWRVFWAARFRQGWRRVKGSFVPVLQASVGAAIAWFVAAGLFGRDAPLFAPIATWVAMGFKVDHVPRKVAELGAGATLGVLLGELFAQWFSMGPWQIFVVLVVSALVGRFLDRGDLFTMQAGVNSLVILGMASWQAAAGGVRDRWLDALVGAGVAFVICVLLPRNPTSRPRRYATNALSEFARLLGMVGEGLRRGDVERLADVVAQRRALARTMTDWEATLTAAREVVNLNPGLWRYRLELRELDRLFRLTRRAQHSAAMLARQAWSMTEEAGRLPVVGGLVMDAARAARILAGSVRGWERPIEARQLLFDVAVRSTPGKIESEDWRPAAMTSIIRAVVVDLLQLSGTSRQQARSAFPDNVGLQLAEPTRSRRTEPVAEGDDAPSRLWGDRDE